MCLSAKADKDKIKALRRRFFNALVKKEYIACMFKK